MNQPEAWDKNGIPILPGDLLRSFHYKDGRRNMYLYHVVCHDDRGYLMAQMYNSIDHKDNFRLCGQQGDSEVVAGLGRHRVDDPIIRRGSRKYVIRDRNGNGYLLCQPHERVRVKDAATQNA